jgi:hypothetical protein
VLTATVVLSVAPMANVGDVSDQGPPSPHVSVCTGSVLSLQLLSGASAAAGSMAQSVGSCRMSSVLTLGVHCRVHWDSIRGATERRVGQNCAHLPKSDAGNCIAGNIKAK